MVSSHDHDRLSHADAASAMCDEWFARSIRGDVAAFESLYRYLHEPLRDFAQSMIHAPDIAEEIVQEVFLSVWRGRETLRMHRSTKGYFYVAVRNRALNHLKRNQVAQSGAELIAREVGEGEEGDTAAERLERDELAARVRRLVSELPPRARQAYSLYYEHELSYAEIATVMGTAVKTVENHLARALRLLCCGLEEHV